MKLFISALVLVALASSHPDDRRPHPRPHGPRIFVRPVQKSEQGATLEFKFGVAGMKPLDEAKVNLKKVLKGRVLEDTDFDISLKTLTEEEIKEWMDDHKEDKEDRDDNRRPHPRPHPHPHFKHAIVASVTVNNATCDDQARYLARYGKGKRDDEEEEEVAHPHPKPHPRPPPGAFLILVKGCKRDDEEDVRPEPRSVEHHPRPHPRPHPRGPAIFLKKFLAGEKGEDLKFTFGVAGMKPLKESDVHLKKVTRCHKLVDTDFDIKLRTLKEEEIKDYMDELEEERKKDEEERKDDEGDHPHPHPRPHPHPHFKHVIAAYVTAGNLTCCDQSRYVVQYGDRHHDDEEEEEEIAVRDAGRHPHPGPKPQPRPHPRSFHVDVKKDHPKPHPHPRPHPRSVDVDDCPHPHPHPKPHPPPGAFFMLVKGCKHDDDEKEHEEC